MKALLWGLAPLLVISGCARAPLTPENARASGLVAARVNTSTHAALVSVPADVMGYMDDHERQLLKTYSEPHEKVAVGVYLVASNDHFKRDRHEAPLDPKQFPGSGARQFVLGMVNADITPGAYEYFLVMRGLVSHSDGSYVSIDTLDDFYVSNLGKNYPLTIQ